jgi:uncharacterized protein (DUF1501 family)
MLTRRTLLLASSVLSVAPSVRAFAAPASSGPILVTLFLRGGMDALGVLAPVDDPDYLACRPTEMRLVPDGDKPALRVDGAPTRHDFRLHPEMGALNELYQERRLAFVHAAGIVNGTRSHFGAQELIERGITNPEEASHVAGGWMARWLAACYAAKTPAFAAGAGAPESLALHAATISAPDLRGGMNLPGGKQAAAVLSHLYAGNSAFEQAARRTLASVALIDGPLRQPDGKVAPYRPSGGASYDDTEIGRGLMSVARVIRMDLGIRAFAVDMGGWDTHENQPGRLANLSGQLARAFAAFHADLHDRLGTIVVVAMSEFGRRLRSNKSNGTDHGHGGLVLVSAPGIAGGRIHGRWPGLSSERLDNAVDLAVTTDIRSVLAEVMGGPLGTSDAIAAAFPNFTPKKIGLY